MTASKHAELRCPNCGEPFESRQHVHILGEDEDGNPMRVDAMQYEHDPAEMADGRSACTPGYKQFRDGSIEKVLPLGDNESVVTEPDSRIPREEFGIEVVDGRPTITIGETHIHLDVHYVDKDGDGSFSTVHDDVEANWDSDGDNGVWWTVFEDFDDAYVEIDPMVTYTGEEAHQVDGVGMDTVVRCDDTDNAYGPGTIDPASPEFCPYCGDSVDDDEHRLARSFDEVFCENTGMSTWRYCPGCGESGVEIGAE